MSSAFSLPSSIDIVLETPSIPLFEGVPVTAPGYPPPRCLRDFLDFLDFLNFLDVLRFKDLVDILDILVTLFIHLFIFL